MLLLSLVGNAYFLLGRIQNKLGGGRHEVSPNGAYLAVAQCLREVNPLNPKKDTLWAELSIQRAGFPLRSPHLEFIELIVTPPGTDSEMTYREVEDLIRWSTDSKTVTFRLPNATISITPQEGELKD